MKKINLLGMSSALAIIAAAGALDQNNRRHIVIDESTRPRKPKDPEIDAWNKAVDAKKAAKSKLRSK